MNKEFTIYTAGQMDFATIEEQTDWRNKTLDYFSNRSNVKVLNPTRRPHGCDLNDKEVFNLDLIDINNSHIILADCRKINKPMFGTPAEIMYFSYVLKRPVIGWYNKEEGYNDKSVFQNVLVDRFFSSLEEALDHIATYYT